MSPHTEPSVCLSARLCSPPPSLLLLQALRSQAQDGWLQRYLAGGRSRAQISEVAAKGRVADSPEARRIAWARMSLLVLYFNPSGESVCLRVLLVARALWMVLVDRACVTPLTPETLFQKARTSLGDPMKV